jgi:hypothetical protein
MSNRLDQDREKTLQPKRMAYAIEQIEKLGYEVKQVSETELQFEDRIGSIIYMFPYSGWHSGSTIKDGRGIKKLLNQIK